MSKNKNLEQILINLYFVPLHVGIWQCSYGRRQNNEIKKNVCKHYHVFVFVQSSQRNNNWAENIMNIPDVRCNDS